jgi:hypothetical protein
VTTFTEAWNAAYEALPPDSEVRSLGAQRIRNLKTDLRERLVVDHLWDDGLAVASNDGKHQKVTLALLNSNPTLDTGDGCLYTKTISGVNELFWEDSAGHVLQLTTGGVVNAPTVNAINQLTGDVTAGPASGSQSVAATLATVNSNVGSFTQANITVNAKGLVTAASSGGFNPSPIAAILSNDVNLNSSTYTDGPSVAQGSSGTWFASGSLTLFNASGAQVYQVKLWDGTTVIASGSTESGILTTGGFITISLSGVLATPAGNLRLSALAGSTGGGGTGVMHHNASGAGKDCYISAFRIA